MSDQSQRENLKLLEFKKRVLLEHIDFAKFMLQRTANSKFHAKWKYTVDCITNDRKV